MSKVLSIPLVEARESSGGKQSFSFGNIRRILKLLIFSFSISSIGKNVITAGSALVTSSVLRLVDLPHDQVALVAAVLNRLVRLKHDAVFHITVAC